MFVRYAVFFSSSVLKYAHTSEKIGAIVFQRRKENSSKIVLLPKCYLVMELLNMNKQF